ncbi:hypothetical protein PT974_02053 [Cladobotryum mycophilum]|uniref:Aminoglycoside phosphotransferase domain-containing protein n=1 Tax=Cladobotryum mycophilum TaxID=491253 RepID=A0ABR0SX46_9HYPO
MSIDDYTDDEWPTMPNGSDFDGKHLLQLVRSGKSPFAGAWDVDLLIRGVEQRLNASVIDIPDVTCGRNNYGIHFKMRCHPDVVVRLARGDINMPRFGGRRLQIQVNEVKFEAAVYALLRQEPSILASRLLYHHVPVEKSIRTSPPPDISGRRLFVFERADVKDNIWRDISPHGKITLLAQAARIRASLFNFTLPQDFATTWLPKRLFEQRPERIQAPVAPTRDFCVALITSKIEATVGDIGDSIGQDHGMAGPIAAAAKAAKESLMRFVPHMLPTDVNQSSLYRLVLEHGDFGIHNMTVTIAENSNQPLVTSLYDWERGCIVPAILSDPMMAMPVNSVIDEDSFEPYMTQALPNTTPSDPQEFSTLTKEYFRVLFDEAPDYERAIQAGKDARHLWFALRGWQNEEPEQFFSSLRIWAEQRMDALDIS